MNNQAIDYLKNTFTSTIQPVFSDNASGIDTFTLDRRNFLRFIEEQEKKFMCSFIDRTTQRNGRKEKNHYYLSANTVAIQARENNEHAGRPSLLFTAVRFS
jgi:glucose-6-phosphate isomerase